MTSFLLRQAPIVLLVPYCMLCPRLIESSQAYCNNVIDSYECKCSISAIIYYIPNYITKYHFFTVPINTLLLPIIGCRVLSAIGFVLTIIGAISSAFGTQIWHLIIGYSIIGGKNNCITTTAWHAASVLVNQYTILLVLPEAKSRFMKWLN